jgi:hypothetical protein
VPHTRHDNFTVHSMSDLIRSNKFLQAYSRACRGMALSWIAIEFFSKGTPKIKAPGNMNIHLWHFFHDYLPTWYNSATGKLRHMTPAFFVGRGR